MTTDQTFLSQLFADRFRVRDAELSRHRVRRLIESGRVLSVEPDRESGGGQGPLHVTVILHDEEGSPVVLLDPFQGDGGAVSEPRRDRAFRLIGRDGGLYVGLRGTIVDAVTWKGETAWRFDFGGQVWVLQRREHYRIGLPPSPATECRLTLSGGGTLVLRVTDISLGGLGGRLADDVSGEEARAIAGQKLDGIRFTLPGGEEIRCRGRIVNVRRAPREQGRHYLVGIQFAPLRFDQERIISAYIREREREIRRRERGY